VESNSVYVVTGLELGWDNVVGVFTTLQGVAEWFDEMYDEEYSGEMQASLNCYVVFERTLED